VAIVGPPEETLQAPSPRISSSCTPRYDIQSREVMRELPRGYGSAYRHAAMSVAPADQASGAMWPGITWHGMHSVMWLLGNAIASCDRSIWQSFYRPRRVHLSRLR
jgi:hypothetical protein